MTPLPSQCRTTIGPQFPAHLQIITPLRAALVRAVIGTCLDILIKMQDGCDFPPVGAPALCSY